MPYCLLWKHADEVVEVETAAEFIEEYQDVIDNRGLEVWWERPGTAARYAEDAKIRACYDTYGPETHDAHVQVYGACAWCRSDRVLG